MKAIHMQSGEGVGSPDSVTTWVLSDEDFAELRTELQDAFGPPTCNMIIPWPQPEQLKESMSRVIVQSDIEGFEEEFARQAEKL